MNDGMTGQRIKELRKKEQLTQKELGSLIGKTESSIRKYEKGLIEIPTSVLDALAHVLNTSPAFLLGYEKLQKELDHFKVFKNTLHLLGCEFDVRGCVQYWNNPLPEGVGYIDEDGNQITGCDLQGTHRTCKDCDIKSPLYTVAYDEKIVSIPASVFENLQTETEQFIKFRLQQLMEKYQ